MYSTLVYLYNQKHEVLLPEETESVFNQRWRPVYSKNLKLNKGVDNIFLFQFYNQDQKPVQLLDKLISFRVIDREQSRILLTVLGEVVEQFKGRVKVTIPARMTHNLPEQLCNYSVTVDSEADFSSMVEESTLPVFVDDNAGAKGIIDIVSSVLPKHIKSEELTLPALWPSSGQVVSSEFQNAANVIATFQVLFDGFVGDVAVEVSNSLTHWFEIDRYSYYYRNEEASEIINVAGHWARIRLIIEAEEGSVTKILVR